MQSRFPGSDFNHVPFLTPSEVEERLHQFELEFADRYSKKDDYYRYANRVKKAPVPVIKPWPPDTYKRFNYRKEAMLHSHRHRNVQRNNRNRPPYHRDVHARLGRFGKPAQAHRPDFTSSSPPLSSPSIGPLPGEAPDPCPSPELLAGPEIELEVSGGEEGARDLTETSSCYLSDEPAAPGTPVIQLSPLSQQSLSSHDNPHSPPCEPQQRSPFSPGTGSDTPGEARLPPARVSPAASDPCTPEPLCPPATLRQDQQGTKRVNLANLSSIQSANGRKLSKDSRSSSCKLISNILASTDYSLDKPKPTFSSHGQKGPPSHTAPPETLPSEGAAPLHVSISLEQVRVPGPKSRSVSKKQRKEPIAPVRIKLLGQKWQLESARKN